MAINDSIPGQDLESDDRDFSIDPTLGGLSEEQRKMLVRQIRKTNFSDTARTGIGRFLRRIAGVPEAQLGPSRAERRQAAYEEEIAGLSARSQQLRKDQAAFEKGLISLEDAERNYKAELYTEAAERAKERGLLADKRALRASTLQRNMLSAADAAKAPGGDSDSSKTRVSVAAGRLLDDLKTENTPLKGELNKVLQGLRTVQEVKDFKKEFGRQFLQVYRETLPENVGMTQQEFDKLLRLPDDQAVAMILEDNDANVVIASEIAFREKTGWREGESQFNEEQIKLINQGDVDAINDYALRQVEAMKDLPAVEDELNAMLRERGVESVDALVEKEFFTQRGLVQQRHAGLTSRKGQLYRDSADELIMVGEVQARAKQANMTPRDYVEYVAARADTEEARLRSESAQTKAEADTVDAIAQQAARPAGGVTLDIPLGGKAAEAPLVQDPVAGLQMDPKTGAFTSSAPSGGTSATLQSDLRKNKVLDELRRLNLVPRGPVSDLPAGGIKTFRGQ